MKRALLILRKDIALELAGWQILPTVAMLGLLIVLVFGFALGQQVSSKAEAAAILAIAFLFAGIVAVEKCFDSENQGGALAGLIQIGGEGDFIFWGKGLWIFLLLFIVEAWTSAVFVALFDFDLLSRPALYIIVLGLFNIGFAGIGVLFAAMMAGARGKGFLLAVIMLVLLMPPVLAMAASLKMIFEGADIGGISNWLKFMTGFDVVFCGLSALFFEKVIES